ncbi:ligand-binding sensor domain-containing protein [Dyadobacter frigoris]|uniref:ligand-binding sensor domain-containing protein n=1 Tax=Dyadobacter frigoris TaxID=2576211 RepID=UPI0014858B2B|nr:two-component regulator propeller domain-containing protein [Dyadobacter frigoris]GLU51460.1 hypothetical protein Dfri01_09210 [Dyadobacter frigoris]
MKKVLLILIILSFYLHTEQVNAQKNYTVTHYTGDNGLPQNSIKSIAADSEGYIWMGTEDGLVRYDGNRFYTFNRFNLDITNTRSIFIQPALRNKKPGREKAAYVHGRNAVSYVYFLGGQAVKIENGKASRDTTYYNQDLNRFKPLRNDTSDLFLSTGLPNFINTMHKPGRYLVRTGNGDNDFFICDNKKFTFYSDWKKQYSYDYPVNNLWNYFTIGDNLYYFNDDSKGFKSFSENRILNQPLSGDIIKHPLYKGQKIQIKIYWNNVADQVYLYLDKYLYRLDVIKDGGFGGKRLTTKLLVEDFDLISQGIEEVYQDEATGKIFLGSGTEGLFVLSKHQFLTLNINGDFRENVFYAQLPYGENDILTPNGKIVGKNFITGKVTEKSLSVLSNANAADKLILVKDKDGTLWTKRGNILIHLDEKNKKVLNTWNFKYNIQTIYQDGRNKLWLGADAEGLFTINLDDPNASPVLFLGKPFFNTTVIKNLSADRLVVGTPSGLYTVDIHTKNQKMVEGTKGVHIKSIYIDKKKDIWLTALEKGLMLLTESGKLVTFPLDINRYLASPHYIIPDNLGYFWIPTNKGLFQVSQRDLLAFAQEAISDKGLKVNPDYPDTELFYSYHSMDEGFKTNEFNGGCEPCAVKLSNHYFSLPSLNGLVWFQPEKIGNAESTGHILLDRAEVNKSILPVSGDTIRFPLNPEQIKLHFSTAYFGNQYNLKISYALVRENAAVNPGAWIPVDEKAFKIEFSNLNSGNYTLIVRKLNGFGINNYTIKKVYFIVPLLWYQTWWANVLMVMLFIAAIYIYFIWKLRNVQVENARLEEVVTRRTTRLNETLKDLEESKNEMSQQVHMLSRLLTSMTHDIQSPLNFIRLTSGNIPKLIEKGQLKDVAMLGEIISDSSRSMSSLLSGLLDYIKAHVYENSLHFEEINLKLLVDEKLEIFKNMITENGSQFRNEISDDTQVYCDYQMLGIMIHNLIDNAAKFTRKGEIRIYFNINNENGRELVISNTTVGVPKEIQDMINAPKKENVTLSALPGQTRTSLGLLIVKEIAALVGVGLRVTQSNVTSFHLIFK